MQKLYRLLFSIVFVLTAVVALPIQASESGKDNSKVFNDVQGVIESKGKNEIVIDGVKYKVASHAKIREGESALRLRHLLIGADIEFDYKTKNKSAPVITSISVIMK